MDEVYSNLVVHETKNKGEFAISYFAFSRAEFSYMQSSQYLKSL